MSISVALRQCSALFRTVTGHLLDDPVHFGMQVFRRLPPSASKRVGGVLSRISDSPAGSAAAAWLSGDMKLASDYVRSRPAYGWQARFLGELALSMGDQPAAQYRAESLGASAGGKRLRSRILWHEGRMSDAVQMAPRSALRSRLESESQVFQPSWKPSVRRGGGRQTSRRAPRASVAYALTNSLPHTQSGYTLRSHAVLTAVREAGVSVIAATRPGYPTAIGKFVTRDSARVDGIEYRFDLPLALGRTPAARLEQQTSFLRQTVKESGAGVIHTTTHFTNGLVAQTVAEDLGIPWVYEVRGSLEDTWAAARGSAQNPDAARNSERFRLFRARETEVACDADAVVTLGHTMAAELHRRGVAMDKILVAPNSVGDDVLAADWRQEPSEVRQQLGLPRDGIWVGTAASVVAYEGLDVLVDAVRSARESGSDVRVLIVGDGVELSALRERAQDLGDHVVFTGRVPPSSARTLVRALDVFVVPRKDVAVCRTITPLKPAEAGGLGRPVILSDLPALAEALPSGARCIVPPESAEALARMLVELAADPEERRRLGQAARSWVEEYRTWRTVGQNYRLMYEKLGVG